MKPQMNSSSWSRLRQLQLMRTDRITGNKHKNHAAIKETSQTKGRDVM